MNASGTLFDIGSKNGKQSKPHLDLIERWGSQIGDFYNREGISREGLAYTRAFENIYESLRRLDVKVTKHDLWLAIGQMDRHKEDNNFQTFGLQEQKKSTLTREQKTFLADQYMSQSIPSDSLPYSPGCELEKMHSDFMDQFGVLINKNRYFLELKRLIKSAYCGKSGKRMRTP